ncbi:MULTISPECIES: YczE/YyaS/YitT family protein [Levilactobacillus]|jgi:uncharacterized membrane protein YczE|uniref:Uncharacterized protein n=1 Tax=Levilactobacillus brevis TaxID=1580 RepID=A0A0C1M9I9_LEVBR|nr:membrane protein [Levilactobacillus brevis]MBL3537551.1 hypothetical protein [Lactobacillus sp. GPR40-2]MBL3630709.1 hypothetical protein [Lactobacillus sp. GPB7-4]ATU70618.1 hypothetical protein CT113_09895 [Levilactobacillus brevis]KID43539.1 putative membrane protein [Levilactobacillus brevis]MBS0946900.1 hypothetical protein [Levilactobacillus brevis]
MSARYTPKTIALALLGIFLVCMGVAFNNNTQLGNDPVGIIYDGLRTTFHLEQAQLGTVSNYLNVVLIIGLFFMGRHYASWGTLMYLVPYGVFVSIGSALYPMIFTSTTLLGRSLGGLVGISLYYLGISLFVAADIGVDPFSGFMLTLRDKTGWSMRRSKITFDGALIIMGVLLGGKFGIITILTALTTGPTIQALSSIFRKRLILRQN